MAEMTAENATAIVTAKFQAVHKSIEKAQDDALDLNAAFLKAGRLLGVHPNKSAPTGTFLADLVTDLADAQMSAASGHAGAKELADDLSNPQPLGGGNGKGWP